MSTEVVPDSITAAEPPFEDAAEEAETQRVLEFFAALELECTSGKFTDAVSKFIFDHADTFDDRDLDQDIPLDWHNIFLAYQSLIEDEIKNVLDAHRVSDEEFATYLEVIAEKDTAGLFAIDYITAALDFEDFCVMMFQHKAMVSFEIGSDGGDEDSEEAEK
ncbi:hypothetical protein FOZ61_007860 [Perkinsus olseni]|uniref:BART domain-containing protein n=1 Tax=Perkinsus olseni TaxID=32597 RepID=A0A7J6LFQ3_PEROL|nr:hypothetical protein FOZ61_007860 [Perkinsus olseni]KAF4658082.1 hypothetical protein FOL46_007129 [Perkinsus olseni]